MFQLHEALASSNGPPVHGVTLEYYAQQELMTLEEFMYELTQHTDAFVAHLQRIRKVASLGWVGYEPAVESDFPPEVRQLLVGPLIMLRTVGLPNGLGLTLRQDDRYAFAILKNGTVVTANEPKNVTVNPWLRIGIAKDR